MRLSRVLALLLVLFTAVASSMLASGCGGTDPTSMTDDGGASDGATMCTTRGTVALLMACTTDCDCAAAGAICTQASYDRSTTPLCTFKCDANNMNANCPNGCNMKGYCKM